MSSQPQMDSIVFQTENSTSLEFTHLNANQIFEKISGDGIDSLVLKRLILAYINLRELLLPQYRPNVENTPNNTQQVVSFQNIQSYPVITPIQETQYQQQLQTVANQKFIDKFNEMKNQTLKNCQLEIQNIFDNFKQFYESMLINKTNPKNLAETLFLQYRLNIQDIKKAAFYVCNRWEKFIEYTQNQYNNAQQFRL